MSDRMKRNFFVLILYICVNLSFSLSVVQIQSEYSDSIDYSYIVHKINLLPLPKDIALDKHQLLSLGNSQIDSIRGVLFDCLKEITVKTNREPSLKSELIKGSLWNQLYQLKVDSAYHKADHIFKMISARFPDNIEGPWFRAINQIESGDMFIGISILDSLSKTKVTNRHFWSDYEKYALFALLPNHNKYCAIDELNLLRQRDSVPSEGCGNNDFLKIYKWSVQSGIGGNAMPKFLYQLKFNFSKKWASNQFSPTAIMIVNSPDNLIPQFYTGSKLNEILFNETEADIYMIIDLNPNVVSLQDFVSDKIQGKYDSISIRDDFIDQQAYSIQGFQRNAHRNAYGSYGWFIAFDRYYYGNNTFNKEPSLKMHSRKIRYLIFLNACKSDRVDAEKKLKPIIETFLYD